MAGKKSLTPHVDYIDECLELLKERISEAKEYLNSVKWTSMATPEDKEKEFKFQATLTDKFVVWINEYARMSGVLEKLEELEGDKTKDLRKGSFRSAFADSIRGKEEE